MISIGIGIPFGRRGGSSLDPDAAAFIAAAEITDPTQINAINTLVKDLKVANLWAKMVALYPFVGGSATSHKFNLLNPLDTDAAFRLVFNGGFTHSANGCQPNGTNGWANTFLTPSIDFNGAYYEGSYHNNTTSTYNGSIDGGTNSFSYIDGTDHRLFFSAGGSAFNVTGAPNNGYHQMMRAGGTGTAQVNLLRNTRSETLVLTSNVPLAIGALNNGASRSDYNSRNYKLRAYGSTGLSNSELDSFYNAVQAFQTILGRQA